MTAVVAPPEVALLADGVDSVAVINALPLGVVLAGPDGRVVLRNGAATAVVGLRHVDLLVEAAVERLIASTLANGHNTTERLELYGPPPRVLDVSTLLLANGNCLAIIEDVSERSRIDAVRTDFVANISHELKTPIGAMSILAEAIQGETDPTVLQRLAEKMTVEAHRMAVTIDDLLELSRIELDAPLRQNIVDLAEVAREAIDRNNLAARAGAIKLSLAVEGEGHTIVGDQVQLISAVSNLIDNAIKYSEAGDTISVRLSREPGRHIIEVQDEGIGIPAPDLERIFERFYRVDKARGRGTGGTGLGLSIVRHVMANHGGEVNVTSLEGEGSTFRLILPATAGDNR